MSSFLVNFDCRLWNSAKRILKYIKATVNCGIINQSSGSELDLIGHCDLDYAGNLDTKRSTSRFVFYFGMVPSRGVWTDSIIYSCAPRKLVLYYITFHRRKKNVEFQYYFIREKHTSAEVNVAFILNEHKFADLFTMPLEHDRYDVETMWNHRITFSRFLTSYVKYSDSGSIKINPCILQVFAYVRMIDNRVTMVCIIVYLCVNTVTRYFEEVASIEPAAKFITLVPMKSS